MLRAVIFDFDGVIADSESAHFRTFNRVLSQYGVTIARDDYYSQYLGLSDYDVFTYLKDNAILPADCPAVGELIRSKNTLFEEMMHNNDQIIDGVSELLCILKENSILMAICSGALLREIELILEPTGLESYFQTIVSADQIERGKPYPDGFLLALARINKQNETDITPSECLVIEDAQWGINAAIAAGMHTAAVTNSYPADQLKEAEIIVSNLRELTWERIKGIGFSV